MKLTVFHVGDGDCLLLSAQGAEGNEGKPHHILVDGGRKTPFRDNAGEFLSQLRKRGEELEVVCVSHIDDDHISGILGMIEDEVAWRVFDLKLKVFEEEGGRRPRKPRRASARRARPPLRGRPGPGPSPRAARGQTRHRGGAGVSTTRPCRLPPPVSRDPSLQIVSCGLWGKKAPRNFDSTDSGWSC